MFSIIIPTWNNLDFVKLCVASIHKNSTYENQVVLHINDGSDGTLSWAKSEGLHYTCSPGNAGVCKAVNEAAGLAQYDYIVYLNDDMYVCPGWDKEIANEIRNAGTDCFMFSGTMIEPNDSGNPCVIHKDYGQSIATFSEAQLLKEFDTLKKDNWSGATWPPTVVHRKYWLITGGYSIEFSPGMSSDDDFSMKMWASGCRIFMGIAKSRIYHFQSKSTQRIKKNNGRKQFLMKWGINQSTFSKYYLRRGAPYTVPLEEPEAQILSREKVRAWIKRKIP